MFVVDSSGDEVKVDRMKEDHVDYLFEQSLTFRTIRSINDLTSDRRAKPTSEVTIGGETDIPGTKIGDDSVLDCSEFGRVIKGV